MDHAEQIEPSAASSPRGPRDAVADIIRFAYRILLPAAPVILALGFGLYVPNVLSLENVVNIIQQASFLFVLTAAQTIVLLNSWTRPFLGSQRVDD